VLLQSFALFLPSPIVLPIQFSLSVPTPFVLAHQPPSPLSRCSCGFPRWCLMPILVVLSLPLGLCGAERESKEEKGFD